MVHFSGPPKPESSHHQDWSKSCCQIKPQYMPTSPYTVFIHIVTCIQQTNCISMCAVYLSVYAVSVYTEEIKLSSTNTWWIYTGVLSLRDLSVFIFWNFYLNNADHHQLAKCAVIIVVIISVYLCLLRHNNNNQCLKSMEPARQVYISPTPPPSDVLYLIRKSGGEKASQLQQSEIVTFAGNLYCIYLFATDETEKMDFFLY